MDGLKLIDFVLSVNKVTPTRRTELCQEVFREKIVPITLCKLAKQFVVEPPLWVCCPRPLFVEVCGQTPIYHKIQQGFAGSTAERRWYVSPSVCRRVSSLSLFVAVYGM